MPDTSYRYFAFISYNHHDKQFAHELQHYLIGYKLPAKLAERYPKAARKLTPIFRDEDALGAAPLNESLISALRSSRYLIVICSEHSAVPNQDGSHYVNDELYHFLGDAPEEQRQRIIPVICRERASVAPLTCMPPLVRVLKLLGIDALSKGKERCFSDVAATLLGIDPRELWEHSQRPSAPRTRPGAAPYHYTAGLCFNREDADFAHALTLYLEYYELHPRFRRWFPELPKFLHPFHYCAGRAEFPGGRQEKLQDSAFLILLCSENSARPREDGSYAFEEEIRMFLEGQGEERAQRIIPLICRESASRAVEDYLPPSLRALQLPLIDVQEKGNARSFHETVAALLRYSPNLLPPPASNAENTRRRPSKAQLESAFGMLGYALRHMFHYSGRSHRQEFWMGAFGILLSLLLLLWCLLLFLFASTSHIDDEISHAQGMFCTITLTGWLILCCFAMLALISRRLHDIGLSSWYLLLHLAFYPVSLALVFSPVINMSTNALEDIILGIALGLLVNCLPFLLVCAIPGKQGVNRYGADPLGN